MGMILQIKLTPRYQRYQRVPQSLITQVCTDSAVSKSMWFCNIYNSVVCGNPWTHATQLKEKWYVYSLPTHCDISHTDAQYTCM